MPRPKQPPRLFLRKRAGRPSVWVILDGARETSTRAGQLDLGAAEKALSQYIAERHEPPRGASQPHELLVAEIVTIYLREHAARSPSREWIVFMLAPIVDWWGTKKLSEINVLNCQSYVTWRTAQRRIVRGKANKPARFVSDQTARHELKALRAAVRYFNRAHGPLTALPAVTLPPKAPQKEAYWLTRDEVAARLRAARKRQETRHIARLILVGIYSGTRPGAILRLRWLPTPTGGWVDVDGGVIHRRAAGAARTKKRQPPVRIHQRLLPHLRRWRKADVERRITAVVHYQGAAITTKLLKAWQGVRVAAGHNTHDTPHVLRHTASTWQMQAGTNIYEAAGFLGMSAETLEQVYGHHSPAFQHNAAQASPKKQMAGTRTK